MFSVHRESLSSKKLKVKRPKEFLVNTIPKFTIETTSKFIGVPKLGFLEDFSCFFWTKKNRNVKIEEKDKENGNSAREGGKG